MHKQRPDTRAEQIARDVGGPVTLVGVVRGGRDLEAWLHQLFDAAAVGGEWFSPTDALLSYVAAHALDYHQLVHDHLMWTFDRHIR